MASASSIVSPPEGPTKEVHDNKTLRAGRGLQPGVFFLPGRPRRGGNKQIDKHAKVYDIARGDIPDAGSGTRPRFGAQQRGEGT